MTPKKNELIRGRDRRPLSAQLHERLRAQIINGDYPPGSRLPSEDEIGTSFGVSRVTVREALRMLQRDRLIESQHGRGHFVLAPSGLIKKPISELQSVTELMHSLGYPMETKVLSVFHEAAGAHASALGLKPEDPVIRFERIRTSLGIPMIYSIDVFPEWIIGPKEPSWSGSLLEIFERAGIHVSYAHTGIRASNLPKAIARQIHIPATLPWVLMEQIHFTSDDEPILFSFDYHRGNKFEFYTLRQRNG